MGTLYREKRCSLHHQYFSFFYFFPGVLWTSVQVQRTFYIICTLLGFRGLGLCFIGRCFLHKRVSLGRAPVRAPQCSS